MQRRIDRRKFLQVSTGAAVTGVALGAGLGLPSARSKPKASARRVLTKEFHLGPAELAAGSSAGLAGGPSGLQLEGGRGAGHLLSTVIESDMLFDYVGLFWSGQYPEGSSVAFWVRTSQDGRNWGPWEAVHVEIPPGPRAQYDTYGALVWADRARYVQFLGELRGSGKKPALSRVGLTLLNPYDGPVVEAASDPDNGGFASSALAAEADSYLETGAAPAAAAGKPITFKREDWGADESLRFSGGEEVWPRAYVPTKKLIVHHTVTSNGYATVEDAKAQVRAIYTYHAKSLGWGDIGYNCLVDKFGNSYEGRRGRSGSGYDGPGGREILSEDVVGGHALAYNYGSSGIALLGTFCTPSECPGGSPSSAMISRLKDVLTWECQQHGMNPKAASDFLLHNGAWHRDLRNVVGHRDVSGTTCPGGNVYALLPQLRSDVAARLANSAAPSVSITSAPSEGTVTDGKVEFAWRGSGGSGGLEYSYYLEGWSRQSTTGVVNYIRGFTSRRAPAWSPWTRETSAQLCFVAGGLYTFHVRVRDSRGRVSVYHDSRTFLGTAQTTPCDGALLEGSGSPVYVVQGGLKRHIPNPVTFEARGFVWGNINHMPDSFVGSVPSGQPLIDALADGNLLTGSGPEVYVMEGGAKRHATSPDALRRCGYGWDAVYVISDSRLNGIPIGASISGPPCPKLSPPSGSLISGKGPEIYVMRDGIKRHIPSRVTFEAMGFEWGNIDAVPESSLASIPSGRSLLDAMADGNLLRDSGDAVYVMEGGRKRHVTSPQVLAGCGYGWDAVYAIPDSLLGSIPTGASLSGPPCPKLSPPSGSLISGAGPEIYVMRDGIKRHIPGRVTFEAMGFQWGNINNVPESSLASIANGDALLDVLADGNLLVGSGPEVYVMEGGLKRHVVSRSVMESCGYGWDAVYAISDSLLGSMPTGVPLDGPPCPRLSFADGTLLSGSGPEVYVVVGGSKRHITNREVFGACGYLWGNINAVLDGVLAAFPTGESLTGAPCP